MKFYTEHGATLVERGTAYGTYTAAMVGETRYAPHFRVVGDRSTHYGPFDCGPSLSPVSAPSPASGACC